MGINGKQTDNRPKWMRCLYIGGPEPLAPPYCKKNPPKQSPTGSWHYPDCALCVRGKCKYFKYNPQ